MTLKNDAKFEIKLTCGLENNMKNLTNFYQSTQSFNIRTLMGSFIQSRKCISLKFTEEFCVITMKNDEKCQMSQKRIN